MTNEELTARTAELNKRKDALPEDQKKYLYLAIGLHNTVLNGYRLTTESADEKTWKTFKGKVYELLGLAISFMNEEACSLLTFYSNTITQAAMEPEEEEAWTSRIL